MGKAADANAREVIAQAIVQQLVDYMADFSEGYVALSPRVFNVNVEPNSPIISLDIDPKFRSLYTDFANDHVLGSIIGGFEKECDRAQYKTLRATSADDTELSYMELKADTWEDLIGGLNQVLSNKNKIDPNILGRGK